ncbi:MAG: hypothetical protein QM638_01145 [Nocardioides sp.]|uniref:hypothetical protein n=1 Tax=Nocardioides sp. TaxID=35761 RepID=UPI0039E235F3
MKIASTTFLCDVNGCDARITVPYGEDEVTSAYLSLVEAGWKVQRRSLSAWRHVCPDHEISDLK